MDKMDIIDIQDACKVAGLPKEIVEKIWKPKRDTGYLDMMRKARALNGK